MSTRHPYMAALLSHSAMVLTACSAIPDATVINVQNLQREGREALSQARYADAENLLTQAYTNRAGKGVLRNLDQAALCVDLGLAMALQGRFDNALRSYEVALQAFDADPNRIHPLQALILSYMCDALTKDRKFPEAAKVCMQAFKADLRINSREIADGDSRSRAAWIGMNLNIALSAIDKADTFEELVKREFKLSATAHDPPALEILMETLQKEISLTEDGPISLGDHVSGGIVQDLQQLENWIFIRKSHHTPAAECYRLRGGKKGWKKRLKNIENIIDDPFDNFKHKIHGMRMLGYRLYLPKFLMRGDPCK